jgi:hypothetical protein
LKGTKDAVDQATVKECDGHFLLVLGLESMLGAISWPMDSLINDEVDLLPVENKEWAEGRVAASDLRFTLNISAGYAPGAGIDRCYQEGTQSRWFVRCGSCRKESCLEEQFPKCVQKDARGRWQRVCPVCGAAIDPDNGRFVTTYPERAKEGNYSFRISSLSIGARDINHIMKRWLKAATSRSKKAKFDCAERAIPNAGALQPITEAEIARMRQRYVMELGGGTLPRYAGVDAGDIFHLLVCEYPDQQRPRVVWAEAIDSDDAEKILPERIRQLGIVSMVIDKKPQTKIARAVAYPFTNIVALQDFKNGSVLVVEEEEHQKKKYRCVKVDRTESLDETTSAATDELFPLAIPDKAYLTEAQAELISEVEAHFQNLRKERTTDGNGRQVDTYVGAGIANHFGMCLNSLRIAKEIAPLHIKISAPRPLPSRRRKLARAAGLGRDSDERPARGRRRGASLRRAM